MCKSFLWLFIIFAFIQIQLRWHRDESYKWYVSLKASGSCPVSFTHKFIHGHPPINIYDSHIEFLQAYQIFVYTNGTVSIDNKKINTHTFVKKGSILKIDANDTVYLDIISGIHKDPVYIPLYK